MFELVSAVAPSYCSSVKFYKWKSQRTGMQLVLINRQSPCVQGYFAVATEANDNSGCPHTLEHIVFMGSQKYPYKGLLDKLGSTQLSSTNAFTAQDRTCYSLSTAGFEGFKNLLPVYLDHVLNATVDESACLTEVYHIDGKGDEKGVVFSEMQEYEHMSDSLMTAEAQKMLFPPQSGYATNTGGCLSALRELKASTIKKYHEEVYCPSNLSVIVIGDVTPEELLATVTEFDNEIDLKDHDHHVHEQSKRPFVHSCFSNCPTVLKKTEIREIEFPDFSDDTAGEILISWLGPHVSDILSNTALDVITSYLGARGAGKFQTKFVNVSEDKALASDISVYYDDYMHSQINVNLYGTPQTKLHDATKAVVDYLETELLNDLDMDFLKQCIEDTYDQFILVAEEDSSMFSNMAIVEFLYGDSRTFEEWLGSTRAFDLLREWTADHWRTFITEHISNPPKACVIGKSSEEKFKAIEQENADREKSIKQSTDLELTAKMLDLAIEHNEQPIPENLLEMFEKPDFNKIKFITSKSAATSQMLKRLPGKPMILDDSIQSHIKDVDLALAFESVDTQFVNIKVYLMPTSNIEPRLLPLIEVLLSNIFSFPMRMDDGKILSGEEVAKAVKYDLLNYRMVDDCQPQEFVALTLTCKASKYEEAIKWLERIALNVVCDDIETIKLFINKYLMGLDENKRNGQVLLYSSVNDTLLTNNSLRKASDPILAENDVLAFLDEDPNQIVQDMQSLLSDLFQKENMRTLVICDVVRMAASGTDLTAPWRKLAENLQGIQYAKSNAVNSVNKHIPKSGDFLTDLGKTPKNLATLTTCPSTDSASITIVSNGPEVYGHEDLPALAVVNSYLQMTEGPFWKAVRGPGLAYGVSIETSVQLGKIVLNVFSASDVHGALIAVKDAIMSIANGEYLIDENCLHSAVSTIVSDLAAHLSTTITAVNEKFLDTAFKGYSPDYVHTVIKEISSVTPVQFLRTLKKYVIPLLHEETSLLFAVASPSEKESLSAQFEKMGYEVKCICQSESDDEEESDSE